MPHNALVTGPPRSGKTTAVHYRSDSGFVGEVGRRDDADVFEVTADTRDALPERLPGALRAWLSDAGR